MKRSKSLKLGLMIAVGTGLSTCDETNDDVSGSFYQNVEHCIKPTYLTKVIVSKPSTMH